MKRLFGLFFAAAALFCGCTQEEWHAPYDDSALKSEIEALKGRVTTLENDFSSLQGMLEGSLLIKSAVQEGENWKITLSNDKSFTVYPEAEKVVIPEIPEIPANLITVTEVDGVKYWAMYVNGKAEPVLDAEGNKVPVSVKMPEIPEIPEIPEQIVPQFKTENGVISVSFDKGNSWIITGYEPVESEAPGCTCTNTSLVSDFEVITEDYYGEAIPVYGIFTLVDGYQFTVTFEGYLTSEFQFSNSDIYYRPGTVTEENTSPAFYTSTDDYLIETPEGWEIVMLADNYGGTYAQITVPTDEAIKSGAAVEEGYVKVIGVMPGGKAVSAKLHLTTKAYNVSVNALDATVSAEPHMSFNGYTVYGVTPAADYDADTIASAVKGMFEGTGEMPEGCIMAEWGVWENLSLEAIYGKELLPGQEYVFWAAPVAEEMDENYNFYYVLEGYDIVSKEFKAVGVSVEPELFAWNDIQISAKLVGVDAFYYGVMASEYFNMEEFVEYQLPYLSYQDPYEGPVDFNGSISEFPGEQYNTDLLPGKKYSMWIVVANDEGKYTADDVLFWEFETDPVEAGGSAQVTLGEVVEEYTSIKVTLNNPGGMVYYAWLNTVEDLTAYPNDALKFKYLLENGIPSIETEVEAIHNNLKPGEQWSLIAAVIDDSGKYGPVVVKDCRTKSLEFSNEKVSLEWNPKNVTVSDVVNVTISCTSADVKQYHYFANMTSHSYWTNSRYLGGTKESAQKYIALNPNGYIQSKTTASEIQVKNLTPSQEYVVLVMAELNDGSFTEAEMFTFTPTMSLGNFVRRDADGDGQDDAAWTAALPTINFGQIDSFGDFSSIPYEVISAEGMTCYVVCAHKDFAEYEGITTAEQMVEYLFTEGREVKDSANLRQVYGGAGYGVFVTWCDAEGNFYETYYKDANVAGGGFGV